MTLGEGLALIGFIVNIVVLIVGCVVVVMRIKGDTQALTTSLDRLADTIEKLDKRLDEQEKDSVELHERIASLEGRHAGHGDARRA